MPHGSGSYLAFADLSREHPRIVVVQAHTIELCGSCLYFRPKTYAWVWGLGRALSIHLFALLWTSTVFLERILHLW